MKERIIADTREKNSLVPSEIIKLGNLLEFSHLEIGDYIAGKTIVERKTFSDLQSSIINKRIFSQLENLKKYPSAILIIESSDAEPFIHANAIRGFLLSCSLDYKIPIIFSKYERETAVFLSLLAKENKSPTSLRFKPSSFSKKEKIQYILEGFPGIGPKTAQLLIKEFKTIKNIINASQEELAKVIGKKAEAFELVE
ncbi:MAG: ERCC4 domain-containing protein [archaeon]